MIRRIILGPAGREVSSRRLRRFIFTWWPFITVAGYLLGLLCFGLLLSVLMDLADVASRLSTSVRNAEEYALKLRADINKNTSEHTVARLAHKNLSARVGKLEIKFEEHEKKTK